MGFRDSRDAWRRRSPFILPDPFAPTLPLSMSITFYYMYSLFNKAYSLLNVLLVRKESRRRWSTHRSCGCMMRQQGCHALPHGQPGVASQLNLWRGQSGSITASAPQKWRQMARHWGLTILLKRTLKLLFLSLFHTLFISHLLLFLLNSHLFSPPSKPSMRRMANEATPRSSASSVHLKGQQTAFPALPVSRHQGEGVHRLLLRNNKAAKEGSTAPSKRQAAVRRGLVQLLASEQAACRRALEFKSFALVFELNERCEVSSCQVA